MVARRMRSFAGVAEQCIWCVEFFDSRIGVPITRGVCASWGRETGDSGPRRRGLSGKAESGMLGHLGPPTSADFALGGVVECAQVAEWLMAADCKSAAPWSYGGSNPPLCTSFSAFCNLRPGGRIEAARVWSWMKRLWVALGVYAVLAGLAWTTISDQSSSWPPWRFWRCSRFEPGRGARSKSTNTASGVMSSGLCDRELGGSNSVVESQPSKLLVAGSIPVSRSRGLVVVPGQVVKRELV